MLTIERSLNIYAAGIPQIISLSQYDDDFRLVFTLYTSEGEFTIPSGTTAEVMGTKVDGNGYSASASISGSTVTVTGNKQMTACAGRNVYEIVLTQSSKRLATVNFVLKVERAALDADTIQSETVLKELNAIIDSAATATEAATQAAASAAAAAESARTLTIDPTLTQSGQAADAKATGDWLNAISEGGTIIITVDKSTFSKLDAYINQGAANLTSDTKCKVAYFACEPNITYTVHKMVSARFRVGYTKTTPVHAVSVYGIQANNDATELTVETGADAAYLVAYYYDGGNDTLSESVIYDSLQVTYEGESSEVTAVDKVARECLDDKVNIQQGSSNAGKVLTVGSDGLVIPSEAPSAGLSNEAKNALLNCFRKLVWIDEHGQEYYDTLYEALYGHDSFPKIRAVFNGGARTIYTDDPLASLKSNIVVKYYANAQDETGTTISNYNITGELINGDSLLTVSYETLSANVIVPCVMSENNYRYTNGDMSLYLGGCNSWDPDEVVLPPFFEANTARRSFYAHNGTIPFRIKPGNTFVEGAYPFHIPATATSVTVSVTPSTMQVAVNAWEADFNNNRYRYIDSTDSGYKTGSVTQNIPKTNSYSGIRTLAVVLKYNSSGSAFSNDPTELTVSFS